LRDDATRQRMGQAGREKIEAEYDISVMVRKVEDEYRRILRKKGVGLQVSGRKKL